LIYIAQLHKTYVMHCQQTVTLVEHMSNLAGTGLTQRLNYIDCHAMSCRMMGQQNWMHQWTATGLTPHPTQHRWFGNNRLSQSLGLILKN